MNNTTASACADCTCPLPSDNSSRRQYCDSCNRERQRQRDRNYRRKQRVRPKVENLFQKTPERWRCGCPEPKPDAVDICEGCGRYTSDYGFLSGEQGHSAPARIGEAVAPGPVRAWSPSVRSVDREKVRRMLRNPKVLEVEVEAIPELISDGGVDDHPRHGWRDPIWLEEQRFTIVTGKLPTREERERLAAAMAEAA